MLDGLKIEVAIVHFNLTSMSSSELHLDCRHRSEPSIA